MPESVNIFNHQCIQKLVAHTLLLIVSKSVNTRQFVSVLHGDIQKLWTISFSFDCCYSFNGGQLRDGERKLYRDASQSLTIEYVSVVQLVLSFT